MEGEMGRLPVGCIANIISFTSPRDACRLSSVSKIFKSAAEYDAVWERFLPPDYQNIISSSTLSSSSSASASSLRFSSKKELFFSLCKNPILVDGGKKSFSLDKLSGKKCYMISARNLTIVWGDTPEYWQWPSLPDSRYPYIPASRFPEVALLRDVCWLEIRGRISTRSLSTGTLYTAYLMYTLAPISDGFEYQPLQVRVGLVGSEGHKQNVCLDYFDSERENMRQYDVGWYEEEEQERRQRWGLDLQESICPKERGDGWMEIELGDFLNKEDEEDELEMSVLETRGGHWKTGLIVQGIELRPKHGK